MKKLSQVTFLILFLLMGSYSAIAQTDAGTITIGGEFSIDFINNKQVAGSTTTDIGNTNTIFINPSFGYFLFDGLVAGLSLNILRTKNENDLNNFTSTVSQSNFGPFIKYYHESGIVGIGNIGFGNQRTKTETVIGNDVETTDFKDVLTQWRLGIGYAHFFNKSISIEPTLSYGSFILKDESDSELKAVNSSLRFSIGFNLFFTDL